MLSMHDDEQYLFAALRAGASGYVLKSAVDRDLVEACRATMRGEAFLYPDAAAALVAATSLGGRPRRAARRPADSARGRGLKLIAEAYTTRQIAEALFISPKTVENHRGRIFRSSGCTTAWS